MSETFKDPYEVDDDVSDTEGNLVKDIIEAVKNIEVNAEELPKVRML